VVVVWLRTERLSIWFMAWTDRWPGHEGVVGWSAPRQYDENSTAMPRSWFRSTPATKDTLATASSQPSILLLIWKREKRIRYIIR